MEHSEIGFVSTPKQSKGLLLVMTAFLLAFLSCASAFYLYLQLENLVRDKKNFEAVRVQLQDQVNVLKQDVEAAQKEKSELKAQVDTLSQAKALQAKDLDESKTQILKLQSDSDSALKEVAKLKTDLAKALSAGSVSLGVSAAANAASPLAEKSGIAAIGAAALPVTPAQAVKTAEPPVKAAAAEASGSMKIKTINRQFNFVVFGANPGRALKAGDTLKVEHNGKWVADLTVQKNYQLFVSAMITKESKKDLIQVGDTVL